MDSTEHRDLDALIESALREEPFRPVPARFHQRIEERLHIAALLEQERWQFRHALATGVSLLLAAVVCATLLLATADLDTWLAQNLPGAMGHWDYFTTTASRILPNVIASSAVTLGLLAAATVLLTLRPLFRFANPR